MGIVGPVAYAGTSQHDAGIRLEGLSKSFGSPEGPVHAVRGIDVAIGRGETVALLGPNGAGKSTTIDMLLGLQQPDGGAVSLFGRTPRQAVDAGTFREDLFYRLNVFPLEVPPLRERREDIPVLVEYFISRYARKAGKTFRRINKRTLDRLRAYPWPSWRRFKAAARQVVTAPTVSAS